MELEIFSNLMDLSKFAKYNKGVKYLLTGIDVFSKYGNAIPLKSKDTTYHSALAIQDFI